MTSKKIHTVFNSLAFRRDGDGFERAFGGFVQIVGEAEVRVQNPGWILRAAVRISPKGTFKVDSREEALVGKFSGNTHLLQ